MNYFTNILGSNKYTYWECTFKFIYFFLNDWGVQPTTLRPLVLIIPYKEYYTKDLDATLSTVFSIQKLFKDADYSLALISLHCYFQLVYWLNRIMGITRIREAELLPKVQSSSLELS